MTPGYSSSFSEYVWTLTSPATMAHLDGSVSAERVTTLCDGNPRAIGTGNYLSSYTITGVYYTQTHTQLQGPYPTPAPCTIGAEECTRLHDEFNTAKLKVLYANTTLWGPPCATSGTTIPMSSVWCVEPMIAGFGNFTNEVLAKHAQLLYWPVRVDEKEVNGLFCTKGNEPGAKETAKTVPGTRTAKGPNTFVTDGITITSPTIAMVYSTVMRADFCGPTITKTIRTMLPEHLSSIRRDAQGNAPRYPFDYNDLNWMCDSGNGTFTMQDGQGPNCYQNVPAAAYFNGPKMWMQYHDQPGVLNGTQVQSWTILNDYEPYIIEEDTFTQELQELYGTNARWLQFGIWDPPIALTQHTAAAQPTLPNVLAAAEATTTQEHYPEPTPATPAQHTVTHVAQTAAPAQETHDTSFYYAPDGASSTANALHTLGASIGTPLVAHIETAAISLATSEDAQGYSPSAMPKPELAVESVTLSFEPAASGEGMHILPNAETTFSAGSIPTSQASQATSRASQEPPYVIHDANVILTINSMTLTASPAADYEILYNDHTTLTLQVGGPAITLGPQLVSALSSGGLARLGVSNVVSGTKQSTSELKAASKTSVVSESSGTTASQTSVDTQTSTGWHTLQFSLWGVCMLLVACTCMLL